MIEKTLKLIDIKPYAQNTKDHPTDQVEKIARSIKEFGYMNDIIVDKDNVLICGHGRTLALEKLGVKEVKVKVADHLTPEQVRLYRIADNKLAESSWNDEMLKIELAELKLDGADITLTGFGEDEMLRIENESFDPQSDEDSIPDAPIEPKTKRGNIYILGRHRLMCGDSSLIEDVEKLMDGKQADLFFTDPPYGENHAASVIDTSMNRKGKSIVTRVETIKNDTDLSFLSSVFENVSEVVKENSSKFVFFKWTKWEEIKKLALSFGEPKAVCVWDRDEIGAATFRFNPSHEFCFYWGTQGDKKCSSNLRNVWRCKKERENRSLHPTVKPVEIIEPALEVSSDPGNLILDLFGGSGSTLIACEKINRQCYMMELDEKYCDVIISRWEKYTGKTAQIAT